MNAIQRTVKEIRLALVLMLGVLLLLVLLHCSAPQISKPEPQQPATVCQP